MYTKNQKKEKGTYWKCSNDKCGIYWEAQFNNCNFCGHPTKPIVIQDDSSEKDAR